MAKDRADAMKKILKLAETSNRSLEVADDESGIDHDALADNATRKIAKIMRINQITEAERNRLANRLPEARPVGVMLDGVRAMTVGRDVVGILVKEDASNLQIKTKDSKSPVQVPKSALLRPQESIKIPEAEAYSADEMVDSRQAKANDNARKNSSKR